MDSESQFRIAEREQVRRVEIRRLIVPSHHVSAEDGMLVAHLVIHPAESNELVAARLASEEDFSAWIAGRREAGLLKNIQRDRRELRRINLVFSRAAEWRSQDDFSGRYALSRSDCREVAREHLRSRYEPEALPWSRSFDGALLACEKEKLVLDQRPADRASELVAL